ncbi:MAG: response regulator [Actinomycetota bacterium]|nr:response regulator [Actinomycetota bacterium]
MEKKEKKVLLVDDDPPILFVLKSHLARKGYVVREAKDGMEALKTLKDFIPDAIVSDIVMPGMNGYELCETVRKHLGEHCAKIPFIFLTSKTGTHSVIHGFRHGADDYITKPFSVSEVVDRINALIDKVHLSVSIGPESALSGLIEEINMPDILQIVEVGRKTGRLVINTPAGEQGDVLVQDGFIIGAHAGDYAGQDAVFELLALKKGQFRFEAMKHAVAEMEPLSVAGILLEGMRIIDELNYLGKIIPADDDLVAAAGKKDRKTEVDDDDARTLLEVAADRQWQFSALLQASSLGRLRTKVAAAKLVDGGILSVKKAAVDASAGQYQPQSRHARSYIVIAAYSEKAKLRIDSLIAAIAPNALKNTGSLGVADFYSAMFVGAHGGPFRVCTVRGEGRFAGTWGDLLQKSDLAVYFNDSSIDFSGDLESFLHMAGKQEKAIIVKEGLLAESIAEMAVEQFGCKYYVYNEEAKLVELVKSIVLG